MKDIIQSLTKEQKLEMYTYILSNFKNYALCVQFCDYINLHFTNSEFLPVIIRNLESMIPEFYKYKPKSKGYWEPWWEYGLYGRWKRKSILKKLIKEIKQQ